ASHRNEISLEASETPAAAFFAPDRNNIAERPAKAEADYRHASFETRETEQSSPQVENVQEPPLEATSVESDLAAPPEAEIYAEPAAAAEQESATSPQAFAPGAGHIEEEIIE